MPRSVPSTYDAMSMQPLPIIDLAGSPHERGITHGRELRDRIRVNLAVYFERFEREVGLSRADVLDRAGRYQGSIAKQAPAYAEGMRGVAAGAGCDIVEIVALNARFELLYDRWGEQMLTDGCTAFAVLPSRSASGAMLAGQSWDWLPGIQGAILRVRRDDGPDSVAYTEAGIVGGKIGLNAAGVTLSVNGLMTVDDDWGRLRRPFHVRCDDILSAPTFDDAVRAVTDQPRNCSANFLITGLPDRAVSLETAPDRHHEVADDGSGCVVHTNHFVDAAETGVTEPPNERRPFSCYRRERMTELIGGTDKVSVVDLQGWLSEHGEPEGLCRHPNADEPIHEQIVTITAAVIEPAERRMHLTPAQPCLGGWQTVAL